MNEASSFSLETSKHSDCNRPYPTTVAAQIRLFPFDRSAARANTYCIIRHSHTTHNDVTHSHSFHVWLRREQNRKKKAIGLAANSNAFSVSCRHCRTMLSIYSILMRIGHLNFGFSTQSIHVVVPRFFFCIHHRAFRSASVSLILYQNEIRHAHIIFFFLVLRMCVNFRFARKFDQFEVGANVCACKSHIHAPTKTKTKIHFTFFSTFARWKWWNAENLKTEKNFAPLEHTSTSSKRTQRRQCVKQTVSARFVMSTVTFYAS